MMSAYQKTGLNVYDIRSRCEDTNNLCYKDMGWIQSYMNKQEVLDALGSEVKNFESCNFNVNRDFLLNGDWLVLVVP